MYILGYDIFYIVFRDRLRNYYSELLGLLLRCTWRPNRKWEKPPNKEVEYVLLRINLYSTLLNVYTVNVSRIGLRQ